MEEKLLELLELKHEEITALKAYNSVLEYKNQELTEQLVDSYKVSARLKMSIEDNKLKHNDI